MNDGVVINRDLIRFLRHENVNHVHNDLSNHLNLLFLKEYCIRFLEYESVAQLLQVFHNCQKLLVLIEYDVLEFILSDSVQHAQED
jgi:hypothetical protein